MRSASVTLALCLALAASTAAAQPAPVTGFVRVEGTHFSLDGRRFRFTGANASIMHGASHRAATERVLDAIAADHHRVVRVWALGEHPDGAPDWTRDYAFRRGPDGWVDASFAQLDRVLDGARARGLRVIVVLANRWSDYGGVPAYLQWVGARPHDAPVAHPTPAELARFYTDPEAQRLYRAHVARVLTHVNPSTGTALRDDPAVFAWELINECDALPRDREALLAWVSSTARFVRSLDARHMIAAGHIGYTSAAQRDTWLAVQRLPEVDYADAHAYPTQLASARTPATLDDFVDDHTQLAHAVAAKPLVWGELGFTTRDARHHGLPRAQWFERFLARARRDDDDGALAWIYSPSADPPREHGLYVDGPLEDGTRDVRAVWSREAAQWSDDESDGAPDPRIDPARGTLAIWQTRRTVMGPGARGAAASPFGEGLRWSLAPTFFARVEAENLGRWDGYAVMHVWASGAARVSYRIRSPGLPLRLERLRVRVRASSELPGRGEGATDADRSLVRVTLDGALVGDVLVPADDGLGAWVDVATDDPAVMARLRPAGLHTLGFEVVEGTRANGLCFYGHATRREPVPAGAGELPGRVQLIAEP